MGAMADPWCHQRQPIKTSTETGMSAASNGDLWVFGYGSLMWRPDFPFVERIQATIAGHHRAFCIASTMHRGTQARPGLVLGLDRGRSCVGVAYRVAAAEAGGVLAYLRARELIYGVYRETRVPAQLGGGASVPVANVLAYTVERQHPSYTGPMPLSEQARVIRGARGQSGANLDYLINTVRHLQSAGIRERHLERLMGLAAGHVAKASPDVPHRAGAAAILAACRGQSGPDLRVPFGDQRRFGYRVRLA
jgi:glutathione-specific gamma-glutamylcyclotransferase